MSARRLRVLGATVLCTLALLPPAVPARAGSEGPLRAYIVELQAPPLAAYRGEITGYAATSPAVTGRRLDAASSAARRYRAQLDSAEAAVLSAAGVDTTRPMYRYRTALSGFAARLTPGEAQRLGATPGVARVSPSRRLHLRAAGPAPAEAGLGSETPAFLGLPAGLWDRLGGPDHAGEGMVVGVLDSGIAPENPSFAAEPGDPPVYRGAPFELPAQWRGRCQTGERWTTDDCNGKIVGARYFVEGFGRDRLLADDVVSPLDTLGHGSHVAGIAAGNYGVDPRVAGNDLGIGFISGVAPRVRVAVYKMAWGEGDGEESDIVAAVDAAVGDGVDVINFSSGGIFPDPLGPMEMAFLAATEAGVAVIATAGNSGLGGFDSPGDAPWVTAVGASTLAREFSTTLELSTADEKGSGTGLKVTGTTVAGRMDPVPFVDARAAAADGIAEDDAEGCREGSLDPAKVEGKAVFCRFTGNGGDGPDRDQVVSDAGGVAVVIQNQEDVIPMAAARLVPGVEVTFADGERIRKFLATKGEKVLSFGAGRGVPVAADLITDYSSRGPQANVPDITKPDLAAPGHDILAAVSPIPAPSGYPPALDFDSYSGTSMAAPQVAGAAILLRQAHPDWSPAEVRSALMTTASTDVRQVDGTPAGPFDTGAGRIDPNGAVEPGLVLDITGAEYRRLVDGIDPDADPKDRQPLVPADLNLSSISFSRLAGSALTRRTVTNVSSAAATWRARVEGLDGVAVTVAPAEFELAPGASQTLELNFRVEGEPSGRYAFGALVLSGDGVAGVHLPLSVRPVPLAAPDVVETVTTQASGSEPVGVQAGYDGVLSGAGSGLAAPRVHAGEKIATFAGDELLPEPGPGVGVYDVETGGRTGLLRGEITTADGGDETTDLDLYLFLDDEKDGFDGEDLVGLSEGPGWVEAVSLPFPDPGRYRFLVLGFETRDPLSEYDFATWVVDDRAPDDPSATPRLAVSGDPVPVTKGSRAALRLEWSGLPPAAASYYGIVTYRRGGRPTSEPIGVSLVRIERT
jgi:subtilisin family serine protease